MEKAEGGGDQRSERRKTTGNTKGPVIAEPMTLTELGITQNAVPERDRVLAGPMTLKELGIRLRGCLNLGMLSSAPRQLDDYAAHWVLRKGTPDDGQAERSGYRYPT